MTQPTLSIKQARHMAVQSQRLAPSTSAAPTETGKESVAKIIEHLGYVQIDTISVIARAHHHTLWNRCADYDSSFLHDLVAADRRIFEYWAHAIAFLPISDYRYYIPRMERHRTSSRAWLSAWKQAHGHVLDEVLNRIRKEGASIQGFRTSSWDCARNVVGLETLKAGIGDSILAGRSHDFRAKEFSKTL